MKALQNAEPRVGRSLAVVEQGPRVILRHPVFLTFDDPFFRMSEVERRPVLVIRLDDNQASLPLVGIMREFDISPECEDGIMFARIVQALEFVTGLRIGDRLPTEVLTGEASWVADEAYQDRAIGRLNLELVAWMYGHPNSGTRDTLARVGPSSMSAENLAAALRRLSTQVGDITPDDALARIRRVASEFAHIDALRDQLLRGAQRLAATLDRLARNFRGDTTHKELLMQVRRLANAGVADLQLRFDEADKCVSNIEMVVRYPDDAITAIRRCRDLLYARLRAWEPYTLEWSTIETGQATRTWHLAHDTYRFLAPRFMTTVEWLAVPAATGVKPPGGNAMVW